MSEYSYNTIVSKAKTIVEGVEKNYKVPITSRWSYYIAKALLTPNKNIKEISFELASNSNGSYISRQIYKTSFLDIAKRLVAYVEKNKRLPNNCKHTTSNGAEYFLNVSMYTYVLSQALVGYSKNNKHISKVEANTKAFTKPTETGNVVYDYFVKKHGKKFTKIDDLLAFIQSKGKYEFYFDDQKTNKQVVDSLRGNCTDWLQMVINMATAMGYECRCVHVRCKVSGTGHVRGQFKHPKHTDGKWINRDPSAVADGEGITSIWCGNGDILAYNPQWFMSNLHR